MLTLELDPQDWPASYASVCRYLMSVGQPRPSREGPTLAACPTFLSLDGPVQWHEAIGRGGSRAFARTEQLCYLAGVNPDPLLPLAPRFERFKEPDGTWYGSYGPLLERQMPLVVNELRDHPDSRRAVATLFDMRDLGTVARGSKQNLPCTMSLVFYRDGAQLEHLACHASMRSCDVWFGLYYDLPAFAMLQEAVAYCTFTMPGRLTFASVNLHAYKRHWVAIDTLTTKGTGSPVHLYTEWRHNRVRHEWEDLRMWAKDKLR